MANIDSTWDSYGKWTLLALVLVLILTSIIGLIFTWQQGYFDTIVPCRKPKTAAVPAPLNFAGYNSAVNREMGLPTYEMSTKTPTYRSKTVLKDSNPYASPLSRDTSPAPPETATRDDGLLQSRWQKSSSSGYTGSGAGTGSSYERSKPTGTESPSVASATAQVPTPSTAAPSMRSVKSPPASAESGIRGSTQSQAASIASKLSKSSKGTKGALTGSSNVPVSTKTTSEGEGSLALSSRWESSSSKVSAAVSSSGKIKSPTSKSSPSLA